MRIYINDKQQTWQTCVRACVRSGVFVCVAECECECVFVCTLHIYCTCMNRREYKISVLVVLYTQSDIILYTNSHFTIVYTLSVLSPLFYYNGLMEYKIIP